MKFDELDQQMRVYETAHDHCVLPGLYMVARIDGRSFTRLTKEVHKFYAPYDERFRDLMVGTTRHLMDCGFRVLFGYTQSDEISLMFHRDETNFSRKLRKLNSVLAGEASARFSLDLGDLACFDCRICQLPEAAKVVDYFRWRNEDANRNALNAHCYWMLRGTGFDERTATQRLSGMSVSEKNELLFSEGGINFNDIPLWQKRGVGVYWEIYTKDAVNQKTGEKVQAERRRLKTDTELPMKDDYSRFIGAFLTNQDNTSWS